MAIVGARATAITFEGVNLQPGDRVKWVAADASSCSSAFDRTPWTTVSSLDTDSSGGASSSSVTASFAFPLSSTGLLVLCYKFNFRQQAVRGRVPPTPYLLFQNIQVVVLRYDELAPSGTAVGCASSLVIQGAGFSSLLAVMQAPETPSNATLACRFGVTEPLARSAATVLDDSRLACNSPSPQAVGTLPLRVDFDVAGAEWSATARHDAAFPHFAAFAAGEYSASNLVSRIDTLTPAGAAYNLQPAVSISGHFTRSYGAPRCRFGNWTGGLVTNATYNATHATCRKPLLPDSERVNLGTMLVAFSPNGQCFGPPSVAASFVVYNSQVNALGVNGAPATVSTTLDVIGEGFITPGLEEASCWFTPKGNTSAELPFVSELQSVSTTLVRCAATPSTGLATVWAVSVLQNGLEAEPSLYGELTFATYDLSQVRVSALQPPGGPIGDTQTSVTVLGSGFAKYGEAQIVCRVGSSTLVAGSLLDEQRILCTLPAFSTAGSVAVTVSLSAGGAGTFPADDTLFAAYAPPYVAAIAPAEGDAQGGTLITISGVGFAALSIDAAERARFLRCALATAAGPSTSVAALSHNDSQVVCRTLFGSGTQPVSVALNAASYVSRVSTNGASGVRGPLGAPIFTFKG